MTKPEIVWLVVGNAVPIVVAPLAYFGLRPLFRLFLDEGARLFAGIEPSREDVGVVAALLTKIDLAILVAAWVAIYTCAVNELPIYLLMGIGLASIALIISSLIFVVRAGLGLRGNELLLVSLIAFAGGNLPIIVLAGLLAVVL